MDAQLFQIRHRMGDLQVKKKVMACVYSKLNHKPKRNRSRMPVNSRLITQLF